MLAKSFFIPTIKNILITIGLYAVFFIIGIVFSIPMKCGAWTEHCTYWVFGFLDAYIYNVIIIIPAYLIACYISTPKTKK